MAVASPNKTAKIMTVTAVTNDTLQSGVAVFSETGISNWLKIFYNNKIKDKWNWVAY